MSISPQYLSLRGDLAFSGTPGGGGSDPLVLRRFEGRYRNAGRLRASFLEQYSENGRVLRTEAGTAYFRKPGKMRWEYESPEKNVFLVDGKFAWFYTPADHTVTRVPAKRSGDWRTPLALLAGEAKVSRICKDVRISPERPSDPKNVLLDCELKGIEKGDKSGREASVSQEPTPPEERPEGKVLFEIDRQTGELARAIVRDRASVTVEFRFSNWQFDPALDESLFHFSPPRGTAIVDGDLDAGRNDR